MQLDWGLAELWCVKPAGYGDDSSLPTRHVMGEMVRPQIPKLRSVSYSSERKRCLSYGSHSLDSGIDEYDSNSFVLVLDSVLNSPTLSEQDDR